MMSSIDRTIERLESELRVLDRQNAWLEAMLEHLDVPTPSVRPRRAPRSPSLSPPLTRDGLNTMLNRIEATDFVLGSDSEDEYEQEEIDDSSEEEEEEEDAYDCDDDESSIGTVVYHTEMWGFHPRGLSRGGEWWEQYDEGNDSDDETVVGDWDDPHLTPMKRYAPVAAAYYNDV